MINTDFVVIVDTREQKPWLFEHQAKANHKLDTGDYSIEGLESILAIERKRNVAEVANNITEKRFKDVVDRLSKIKHSYILLEFNLEDVMKYPIGSDIPKRLWDKIRVSPAFIIKHLIDIQVDHNIKIIFCDNSENAEKLALALMKKVHKLEKKDEI
jgi:ERCC4-type nuclease